MPGLVSPGFACLAARRWGFGSDDLVISAGFLLLGMKFSSLFIFFSMRFSVFKIFLLNLGAFKIISVRSERSL